MGERRDGSLLTIGGRLAVPRGLTRRSSNTAASLDTEMAPVRACLSWGPGGVTIFNSIALTHPDCDHGIFSVLPELREHLPAPPPARSGVAG